MTNNISRFDSSRETAGAIYRNAQIHGEKQIITGDMNYELRKSLVEDINEAVQLGTKEFEGKPFYIAIYEKRDLMMKNAFVRRLFKTKYRPYPEHDTTVFKAIPAAQAVYFCWCLPHRSHMRNILACPEIYDPEEIQLYRKWENLQLDYFGFVKDEEGNWKENPFYVGDKLISNKPGEIASVSMSSN